MIVNLNVFRKTLLVALGGGILSISCLKADAAKSEATSISQPSREEVRLRAVASFQAAMQGAETNEQKQTLVDAYRAEMEKILKEYAPVQAEEEPSAMIARMKAIAGNDAQELSQVARLEKIFQEQAEDRLKLEQINLAQSALKQHLVEVFRAEQETRIKNRETESRSFFQEQADLDDKAPRSESFDPQLAKVKQRQQEYDQTMAAVYAATSTAEKARLIDEWRAKSEAEMKARQAELKHLEVP